MQFLVEHSEPSVILCTRCLFLEVLRHQLVFTSQTNAPVSQVNWWWCGCSENLAGPFEEERPLLKPLSPPGRGSHTCTQKAGYSAVIQHNFLF